MHHQNRKGLFIFRKHFLKIVYLLFFFSSVLPAQAQQPGKGYVKGKAFDDESKEPLAYVNIIINETGHGGRTDSSGYFFIGPIPKGQYTLKASHIGYDNKVLKQISISSNDTLVLQLNLKSVRTTLDEVTVQAAPFKTGIDIPASLHSMVSAEIQRNPGSDNDISKVVRMLPGVTTMSSFRNDLIIRGGAPNENRFYLDEVEIPVINHLVTQGASGGAYSIINSLQLREVDYMSSSFPANRGNALSSVFNFMMKEPSMDSLSGTAILGGTTAGLTLEGPAGENVNYSFSVRRSYRQYILKLLDFAFLPVYNDMTARVKVKLSKKSSLTLLGIGAIDEFTLNEDVSNNNEIQRYLVDNLPYSDQSNYTLGAVYKIYSARSSLTVVGSRSGLKNSAEKYMNNDPSSDQNLILKYNSLEYSNRARAEYAFSNDHFKVMGGAGIEDLSGSYDVFNRIYNQYGPVNVGYVSDIRFQQYGFFGQISKGWFNDRLALTLGSRADGNNYNQHMKNPLDQVSANANLSIGLSSTTAINLGVARYNQIPPMMTLSYSNSGELENKDAARYIKTNHYVAGIKWDTPFSSRLSLEGFLKTYPSYMLSLRDSISLAHMAADFGVFGNFPVNFSSEGRAYGFELYYQQRMFKGFYGILSYTLSWSEYKDKTGVYVPSSWDARHIVSFNLGKRINQKWEVGINWRMQSKLPFTPFDTELSSFRSVWDINNQGIRDYSLLNTERGKFTNIINMRVDRVYKFNKWSLNVYLDLENITADTDSQQALILDRKTDANGNLTDEGLIVNPDAPYEQQKYRVKYIANGQGAFIPTFGFIVSF